MDDEARAALLADVAFHVAGLERNFEPLFENQLSFFDFITTVPDQHEFPL